MEFETTKRKSGKRTKKRKNPKKRKLIDPITPVLKSSSAKKIKLGQQPDSKIDEPLFQGYRIIDMNILNGALSSFAVCKLCGAGEIYVFEDQLKGLGSQFVLECRRCDAISRFSNCEIIGKERKTVMELNRRIVYAMRCLGVGLTGIETFCGIMDLPPPIKQTAYQNSVDNILEASGKVASESMKLAAAEEIASTNSSDGIAVSLDGTWMKRGHTSHHGVVTCIGTNSGKVVDVQVQSTHCKRCEIWKKRSTAEEFDRWYNTHKGKCLANHKGSAGKMEVEAAVQIFKRSKMTRDAKYLKYIGDGDTQSYLGVVKSQPYGSTVAIEKVECVGHVQKRMGTRLRKLKLSLQGKKLADGKVITGKGRLTLLCIDKLTVYFGNAIRDNKNSLESMRKAVWAVFHHSRSNDKDHNHSFCPSDVNTWCSYWKAKNSTDKDALAKHRHKNPVPVAVMDAIKPVFLELTSPQLLKRCLGGKTQNNNESINNVIWKYCPKTGFAGRKIVEVAANEAVIGFNDGMRNGRIKVLKELQCKPGVFSVSAAVAADKRRIHHAEIQAKENTLESRRANRRRKTVAAEKNMSKEGVTYSAGAF